MLVRKLREHILASSESPVVNIVDEFKRLRLLENAVINYSGGMVVLSHRIRLQKQKIIASDPATAQLLNDIANYLSDVALAGALSLPEREND
ncbi:hypothetical protein MAQ58_13980 [Enterobacter sp. DRP3]|nr:hypothetical protein [Enterobacter sp. DRP3]